MDIFDEVKETYYEEKIRILIFEFKKLFVKMIKDKNYNDYNEKDFFSIIAKKVKECYPEMENRIDTVLYYYAEEKDDEEKLENLMKLYKIIKENVYGN